MYFLKKEVNNLVEIEFLEDGYTFINNRDDFSLVLQLKEESYVLAFNDRALMDECIDLISFLNFYKEIKNLLTKNMNEYNDNYNLGLEDNYYINEVVSYFKDLNSEGKFIRGFLILLGYKLSNGMNLDKAIPLSLAFEVFQTSVLVHDDIIDKALIRRGKKTIPSRYIEKYSEAEHLGDSIAICAGDLGFYKSFEIMIENYCGNRRLLEYYNNVIINTIQGEILDVLLPHVQKYGDIKHDDLEDQVMNIYRLKTSWYSVAGPICMGMILGDASDLEVGFMEKFAYNLGVAFQIKDDILGVFSNRVKNEKTSSDISEFKQTILYSYVYEKCPDYLSLLHKYYGKEDLSEEEIGEVINIFKDSGALKYANEKMNSLFLEAREILDNIDFISKEDKAILRGFITFLNSRDH